MRPTEQLQQQSIVSSADLETDFYTMGTSPNGLNINDGVGSTHPEALAEMVVEKAQMLVWLSMATAIELLQSMN